jgi:hypothetical protein
LHDTQRKAEISQESAHSSPHRNGYPPGWGKITEQLKSERRGRCQMCDELVDEKRGHTFQSHHLDHDKDNIDTENLLPSCQRCHERLQRIKITMGKTKFLEEMHKVMTIPNHQAHVY